MSDREEVVTEFNGLRVRSSFEIIEVEPDCIVFQIEWPLFEFDDEEPDATKP